MGAMENKRRKGPRRPRSRKPLPQPKAQALTRAPKVDMQTTAAEVDQRVFAALAAVTGAVNDAIEASQSIAQVQLLATHVQLLGAMESTHQSIRSLMSRENGVGLDLTVDALPLARIQLERAFLALLLAENPKRWHTRYRKNAWKALAEKFFRDRCMVGHLEGYREYFDSNGPGIATLRAFAHEMGVTEDEFQTLRADVLQDEETDPRWEKWFIPDMPTPRKSLSELADPVRHSLADLLYPAYDSLSHFSHGGMAGVLGAAVLRAPDGVGAEADREQFWASAVLETALPMSYVALVFVATVTAMDMLDSPGVGEALVDAWRPYVCDGMPLGVALWDAWACEALGAEST